MVNTTCRHSIIILINVLILVSCKKNNEKTAFNKIIYSTNIVFRETPYSDIKGANEISKQEAQNINHFEFSYDNSDRLKEVKYVLNGSLKPYYDRFVRAPHIKIKYNGNEEIRNFYNENGQRTLVSGDVYEVRIKLSESGERESLQFYDVKGNVIENDFGIATYKWIKKDKNHIIEYRYDSKGDLQRNRPGFGYMITEFKFLNNGFLDIMTNLGESGDRPVVDESGIVSTKIGYDEKGQFVQWLNLDVNGKPKKGMSSIAEIRYTPSRFIESDAEFIDENGNPQTTTWGAHLVKYSFDNYGNVIQRKYFGLDKQPINVTSDSINMIKTDWAKNGKHQVKRSYFNKQNQPIGIGENNIHQFKSTIVNNRLVIVKSYDLDNKLVNDDVTGFAIDKYTYDDKGRLIKRSFLDKNSELVNHNTLGVANFNYQYNKEELTAVICYNAEGIIATPLWNPRH